jgi:signal transduction histidine kinase
LSGEILLRTIRIGYAGHAPSEVIMDEQGQDVSGLTLDSLSGGGEIGRHLRAHDWSASALGRPERWPLPLRNAAKLVLAAPSPIALGWGPDLLTLHNDAFARTVCANVPHGIALPFRQLFPELWQGVGSLMERAMQRGESALLENQLFCIYRSGYAEEIYLSFRCNPVADHSARVLGVIVTASETTTHVISARRAAALHDVATAGGETRSVEDACYNALEAVSRHSAEIPFALLYARDASQMRARLVATASLAEGTPASPTVLALDSAPTPSSWPVRAAIETNRTVIVDDLLTRFEPLPAGDWPFAPRSAVVVPLATQECDRPDGVLVMGVSARRELDAEYLDFIELVAKQVIAVMSAGRQREDADRDAVNRAAAKVAQTESRARTRMLKAKVAGVLEERTRLAREIHDTLLQDVTGIALQLRAALPHVQTSPDDALTTLARVADLAESTSREARQVVWDMRPSALNEEEFVRAVEITAHRTVAGAPVAFQFSPSGRVRRLDEDTQQVVLRVVREAVANVVRHAAAKSIQVTLSFGARRLRVAVVDDGRGFTVASDFRSYSGHWGLVGMQERADQIGASLRVRSEPHHGTTVTLDLPFHTARAKRPLATRGDRESALV